MRCEGIPGGFFLNRSLSELQLQGEQSSFCHEPSLASREYEIVLCSYALTVEVGVGISTIVVSQAVGTSLPISFLGSGG